MILANTQNSALIVTPWFPNFPGDRNGNFVYESARSVSESGWDISVFVSRPWVPRVINRYRPSWHCGQLDQKSFCEFGEIKTKHHLSIPRNYLAFISDQIIHKVVKPELLEMSERKGVRIIHAHTEGMAPIVVEVAKKLGIKSVVTIHGLNTGPRYFDNKARRNSFRTALRDADRVVLVGEPLRAFFRDLVGNDKNFRVVHNGFSFQSYQRKQEVLLNNEFVSFISISNLHEGKGIELNIQALAALKDQGLINWSYVIIGDGPERPMLESMVSENGLSGHIEFTGAIAHKEIGQYLACADVFVLPSYREAFGIAYLEAMAAGLLTIGVQGQGPEAFIKHDTTGLLVSPNSSKALTEILTKIVKDPASFRTIAEGGRNTVRREFTWAKHAECMSGLYSELVG